MLDGIIKFCSEHWILCLLVCFIGYNKYKQGVNAKAMENIKGSLVKKIDSQAAFEEAALNADGKLILVDYYATWCGPCVKAAPIFAEMSKEYEGKPIELWKVDVDGKHTISRQQGISCMPTFKFYRSNGGKLQDLETIQGWSETQVRNNVAKYLSS
jgi:thioredoxin 1